jgi:crossover junction endodeoxyribonuclease RusA
MTTITIELPWPDAALSPNGRLHWAKKARAVKDARSQALYTTRTEYRQDMTAPNTVDISMCFYPPTKRHYDLDNLQSRCKAYQDGIFQALGWNDKIIEHVETRLCQVRPGGQVIYTIQVEA